MIQQSKSSYTDLVLYTDKTITQKDTGTSMFIAALVTVNKKQRQPKCPATDEWIKMMWCIDNGILLSHEKNKMPFEAIGMKLEIIILVKADNDKYRMWNLIFKNDINEVIYKTETDSQILKTTFWLPKRKYGGKR